MLSKYFINFLYRASKIMISEHVALLELTLMFQIQIEWTDEIIILIVQCYKASPFCYKHLIGSLSLFISVVLIIMYKYIYAEKMSCLRTMLDIITVVANAYFLFECIFFFFFFFFFSFLFFFFFFFFDFREDY